MKSSSRSAFPIDPHTTVSAEYTGATGLTKLEYAAIHIAPSIIASPEAADRDFDWIASRATLMAITLFERLEQIK